MEQGAQLSDERKQYHSTDKLRAFQVYRFSSVRRVVLKYQSDFPTTFDSLPLYAGEGWGLGVHMGKGSSLPTLPKQTNYRDLV